MNIPRMRALMRLIAAEPRRMRMETLAKTVDDFSHDYGWIPDDQKPPCGTVFCIAGTAVIAEEQERGFFRKRFDKRFADKLDSQGWQTAMQWLELTDIEAQRLFFLQRHVTWSTDGRWPADLEEQYNQATTPAQRTAVVLARMRRFIKTDGKE